MSIETVSVPQAAELTRPISTSKPRYVSTLVILIGYWAVYLTARLIEMPYFFRFLCGMAAPALFTIVFSFWWLRRHSVGLGDRLLGYFLVIGGAFFVVPLTHPSIGLPTSLMNGLPLMLTIWMIWTLWLQRSGKSLRRFSSLVVIVLTWGSLTLIRMEGLNGDLKADVRWRWSPTSEELFLSSRGALGESNDSPKTESTTEKITAKPGDWTGFRGPHRDGTVVVAPFETRWNEHPPKLLWKQRIGPAWSSVIVIGDRLYTQEQRGDQEAVVCYSADSGKEIWSHYDTARFWEAVSGTGPRATPEFSQGRLYTLGATGLLNCLDATSGQKVWSHDLQVLVNAKVPQWGASSSPLVTNGLVIVYGGGANQNNLLAFDAETGESIWSAEAGQSTYSSPQLTTILDESQVLMLSDGGVVAVSPETGKKLWNAGLSMEGPPRNLQSHVFSKNRLLSGFDESNGGLADRNQAESGHLVHGVALGFDADEARVLRNGDPQELHLRDRRSDFYVFGLGDGSTAVARGPLWSRSGPVSSGSGLAAGTDGNGGSGTFEGSTGKTPGTGTIPGD